MSSLILLPLDYGNATLAGIALCLLQQLQSVMNLARRLVFLSSRFDHITPLLWQLYWLTALERIQFKLAVLVYKCLHMMALSYLADELQCSADFEARRWLRSTSTSFLIVRRTWRPTVSDRALLSLSPVRGTVCLNVCTLYVCFPRTPGFPLQAFLSMIHYPNVCSACAMTVVIFGHLNRSFYLLAVQFILRLRCNGYDF